MSSSELRRNWPVVAAAFTGMLISGGAVSTYVLGPITKPLQAEFHWSRAGISVCQSLLALGITLGTPLFGWLADRTSPRFVALGCTIVFCACFAYQAFSSGVLWEFQALYFLCGFLGAGSGAVIYTRAIGEAFNKKRGIALGMALSGTGATALVAPLLVAEINQTFGWRTVFDGIAALILVIALPVVYLGLGRRPRADSQQPAQRPMGPEASGVSRSEALGDARFYLLLLASMIFGLFIGSLIINFAPVLIERGLLPVRAAQIASVLGVAIIVGRLLIGTLLDRFSPSVVGASVFGFAAAGTCLFLVGGVAYAIAAVVAVGLTTGAELDIFSFMALRYFGLKAYGMIFGMLFCGYTAANIVGPVLGTMLLTARGYKVLFGAASAGFILIAILFLILRLMRPPHAGFEPSASQIVSPQGGG
jgi:MFS family permease